MTLTAFSPVAQGQPLSTDPQHWGELRESSDVVDEPQSLRERMATDGYIFLRGWLNREDVREARHECLRRLADLGHVDPGFPLEEGVATPGTQIKFSPELAHGNAPLLRVLYSGAMLDFYERILDEPVRHFDYTWMRAVTPGAGTAPHCDVVYMGRGTQELFTSWTPLGDVDLQQGGLMVLEGSHLVQRLRDNYCQKDVDSFCTNRRGEEFTQMGGGGNIRNGGHLSVRPATLRERLGGRWLTTSEYRMGDLLAFSVYLVHASLDNTSPCIRLSSDSRYQRASQPADERWIGPNPPAHGPRAKRGMIC